MADAKVCRVTDCRNQSSKRGMCNKHYLRWRKHGSADIVLNPISIFGPTCCIDGCEAPHHSKGYCLAHSLRNKRHGDPLAGGPTRATNAETTAAITAAIEAQTDECITWPFGATMAGYGQVTWEGQHWLAHRLICRLAHGEPPEGKGIAAHSCGKGHKGCINPRHLRWASVKENDDDKVLHGMQIKGTAHKLSKLDEAAVRRIRDSAGVETLRTLAEEYGVSESTVSSARRRRHWAWLE